jgi:hypothetical protein
MSWKNPFERYGIDPMQGPAAITERMRELAEDASEDERAEIRAAWEELTLHPLRRLHAAFGAHPETRPPLGAPPPGGLGAKLGLPSGAPIVFGPMPEPAAAVDPPLTLGDLAVLPSVAAALGGERRPPPRPAVSLEDDPILTKASDAR